MALFEPPGALCTLLVIRASSPLLLLTDFPIWPAFAASLTLVHSWFYRPKELLTSLQAIDISVPSFLCRAGASSLGQIFVFSKFCMSAVRSSHRRSTSRLTSHSIVRSGSVPDSVDAVVPYGTAAAGDAGQPVCAAKGVPASAPAKGGFKIPL